ncbi:Protein N-acetyltransferase, RimJ/RimL family [Oceanobacillus limi]|uniref:Protein N-acetyltransferase, RimJ/RimL family n=1 Tax=Oceanobacillus limi TaxID=930131 RepID=A0A1I0GLC8_9BACI|nr:GNAT family N-acetyltransferase [Oceanobacillus limi]SET70983.1 Protein N-acetyltransferase, RimJ/RimL family [Oceanobacillus limi]
MLKPRDLHDVPVLFELMSHPEVFPYVRQKAATSDEFYFLTRQTIEAEANGELISRTIVDDQYHPIGTINLFDIKNNQGFLATWIGQPYFGKGYNKLAKEQFFEEIFYQTSIETIFMKVRKTNTRSLKAVLKIPYVALGNSIYADVYEEINANDEIYDLFAISKEHYMSYHQFSNIAASEDEVG